jgi:hypothetical protein
LEQEASLLGYRWIGTEHILVALAREKRGSAAILLRDAGIDYAAVQARIRGHRGDASPDEA